MPAPRPHPSTAPVYAPVADSPDAEGNYTEQPTHNPSQNHLEKDRKDNLGLICIGQ